MSQQSTINPFPGFGTSFSSVLDDIIANIPASPKVSQVNDALVTKIKSIFSYSSDPLNDVELNSYFPSAINAYINNDLKGVSPKLAPFVVLLLEKIKDVPPLQIMEFLSDVENQISEADLSLPEQNQLYLATATAKASYYYWTAQNDNLGTSAWAVYLDTNKAVNIANLPYWVTASVQAALYFCFKGNYQTLSSDPPKITGPDYVTVLTASAGIAAGKVIFSWIPKVSDGFSLALQNNNILFEEGRKNSQCTVANNCNGGNCSYGCGHQNQ